MFKCFKRTGGLVVVLAAVTAALSANAFTASNTVSASVSGAGSAGISGYAVTNPSYTYSADGTTVTAATFNLDSEAADVTVALTATPVLGDWQNCGASAPGTPWLVTCTFATPVPVASATKLSVVAVGSGTATIA
jgi:hypothetical protein